MRPNSVLQRFTSTAAACAWRRRTPHRPRPKRLSGKQPASQTASNLVVCFTAPLCAFAYTAANSPNPAIVLLAPDQNTDGEFLVVENRGPGWLKVLNFAVTTDGDGAAAAAAAAAVAAAPAWWLAVTDSPPPPQARPAPPEQGRATFERVAKDLEEDAALVNSTLDKLLFEVPTTGTGIQPGGRFVVIKVKKGETLAPAEKLLLQMVHDRWTVSIGYRICGLVPQTYCKRLDVGSGEEVTLKMERDLAAKVAAGGVATELDEADVRLYRLKYKALRVENWKAAEDRAVRRYEVAHMWWQSRCPFKQARLEHASAAQALHASRAKAEALAELHEKLFEAEKEAREERDRLRNKGAGVV